MLKTYLGQIYLALAASIWGGMYVVSKAVLAVIQPLELVWLRYLVALAALGIMGVASRQSWRIHRKDMLLLAVIGIVGYFISIWAQFAGTQLSSAQMGAVVTAATPAFMVLFARVLLQEKITLRKAASVLLATIGVLMIVGLSGLDTSFRLGGMVLGIAALTWAFMSVLIKKVPREYSPLVVTTYAILAAFLLITPFVIPNLQFGQRELLQPMVWGGVLYVGIVSTAGAFYFWNKGLQMVDAATAGLYFFFQPLAGTLLGWFFLGEQVDITFWIGAVLIAAGVLLVVKE